MTLRIGATEFDKYEGTINLPKLSTRSFTHCGVPHAGVQIRAVRPEPFKLKLWYHDDAQFLAHNQQFQRDQISTAVYLNANGVSYEQPPYRLRFFVIEVSIIKADLVAHASGTRNGSSYSWTPASLVVSEWTLLSVPLFGPVV